MAWYLTAFVLKHLDVYHLYFILFLMFCTIKNSNFYFLLFLGVVPPSSFLMLGIELRYLARIKKQSKTAYFQWCSQLDIGKGCMVSSSYPSLGRSCVAYNKFTDGHGICNRNGERLVHRTRWGDLTTEIHEIQEGSGTSVYRTTPMTISVLGEHIGKRLCAKHCNM